MVKYAVSLGVSVMTVSYKLWHDALLVLVSMVTLAQAENTYLPTKVIILFVQNYGQGLRL